MASDRPHIVLITSDQQRCDSIRAYGNAAAVSPSVDRFAAEGVLFEQAHTSAPVCLPARVGLLCGLHTPAHMSCENGFQPLPGLTPFTDFLKERGYYSAVIGKTHFGPCPDSYDLIHGLFGTREAALDDLYQQRFGHPPPLKDFPHDYPGEMTRDGFIATLACEHLSQHAAGDLPTFTHVSFNTPHGPYHPPTSAWERVREMQLPPVEFDPDEWRHMPEQYTKVLRSTAIVGHYDRLTNPSAENQKFIDRMRRLYYAMAVHVDDQIGRVLTRIDELGIRDNTLVIFTSDHGVTLFDHGFTDKHFWYDQSWRVPLILRWPGRLPSGQRAGFASWTDVTATILAASGSKANHCQGFDLIGQAQGTASTTRTAVAAALHNSMAVATESWKLEHHVEENRTRLWDRKSDPAELCDLWPREEYRPLADALQLAVLRWHAASRPWDWLASRAWGAGGIGVAALDHVRSINGADAERRLTQEAMLAEQLAPATASARR